MIPAMDDVKVERYVKTGFDLADWYEETGVISTPAMAIRAMAIRIKELESPKETTKGNWNDLAI